MGQENHALVQALIGNEPEETATITPILPEFKDETAPPAYEVVNEQPWHRSCAYMMLQGHSNKECAEMFGKTQGHISQLKKQQWFKSLLAQLAEIHFDNDVAGLLENAAYDAISTLTDLAVGAKSESVRRSAASDLLDKFLKNQPVKNETPHENPAAELEQLDEEIERLKEQT